MSKESDAFEDSARRALRKCWGVDLTKRPVRLRGGVIKRFDLVSKDGRIVGDAKYYKNIKVPAAKFSTIAEYVWLLQNALNAHQRFLIFGRDREVPARWLQRYAPMCRNVEFLFLKHGRLIHLKTPDGRAH